MNRAVHLLNLPYSHTQFLINWFLNQTMVNALELVWFIFNIYSVFVKLISKAWSLLFGFFQDCVGSQLSTRKNRDK